MEKILEEILKITEADRVILYRLEPNKIFASRQSLFQIKAKYIVSTNYADNIMSKEDLYKKNFLYHIFVDAINILFNEGSFSFIPGIDNRISEACTRGLENLCLEAGNKSLNYFLIDDKHLISIHNCKKTSLLKKSHIESNLKILKNLL